MKKIIIIALSLLVFESNNAQDKTQYLNLSVGGGVHNLTHSLLNGTNEGSVGFIINGGYSYFFTPQWGLQTGLGIQSFGSKSTLNYLSGLPAIDTDGDPYEFRANYKNWQEKQQALFVNIPLVFQYKYKLNRMFSLLTSAGAEVSIPIKSSYVTTGGEITTTGFYSQWNVELSDMPQHGFGNITDKFKGDLSLKSSYSFLADIGGLYNISKKLDLYVGGYFNLGLNNIITPKSNHVYQADGVYNGVYASGQTTKVTPFAIGMKVGLYWKKQEMRRRSFHKRRGKSSKRMWTTQSTQAENRNKLIAENNAKKTDSISVDTLSNPKLEANNIQNQSLTVGLTKPDSSLANTDYEKAKEIASTIKFPFGFKTAIKTLGVKDSQISELDSIKKKNPNLDFGIVSKLDNITFFVKDDNALSLKNFTKNGLALQNNSIKQESVFEEKPIDRAQKLASSIVFPFGLKSALRVLNVEVGKINALSKILDENKDLNLNIDSHFDSIAINVVSSSVREVDSPLTVKQMQENKAFDELLFSINKISMPCNFYFKFNSDQLYSNNFRRVKLIRNILMKNSNLGLSIVGHTDSIGSYKANLFLGLKRAMRIMQKFITLKIPVRQLRIESKAYDHPNVINDSKKNRAKNRRVEVSFYKIENE